MLLRDECGTVPDIRGPTSRHRTRPLAAQFCYWLVRTWWDPGLLEPTCSWSTKRFKVQTGGKQISDLALLAEEAEIRQRTTEYELAHRIMGIRA